MNPIGGAQAGPMPGSTVEPVSPTVPSTPEPLEALAAKLLIACSAPRLATESRRGPTTLQFLELVRDTSLARHCPNHDFNGADWAKKRAWDSQKMSLYVYDGASTPLAIRMIRVGLAPEDEPRTPGRPYPRDSVIDLVW